MSAAPFRVLPTEHKTDGLWEELKDIQHRFRYLPADQLKHVAERRGLNLRDLHAVASFYPHFYLTPPAKVCIRVCDDMTCHLRGAPEIQEMLHQRYANARTEDLSIGTTSCLGRCDHAPAMMLNENYYDGFGPTEAAQFIDDALAGNAPRSSKLEPKEMKLAADPYDGQRPYTALREYVQSPNPDWAKLLGDMQKAGLRGMGGAGFPTARKWQTVHDAPGTEKYVVCNADESEPGTIKDRFIMTQLPHLVIEGMALCGLYVGAKRGYLYIRHEYGEQEEILREELVRAYREKLLGKHILGTEHTFDLTVFVSPGGYICGEESALLEAIEGKRSEPRNKPPFVATNGLWDKPTALNNVETFSLAALIAAKGADYVNSLGKNGVKGIKFVGISGDVNKPGVYEVPMGTTYAELFKDYAGGISGGRELLGFAPSGPSSGYLPASMTSLRLDWDEVAKAGSMVGSGAVVVCADNRCMLDMAFNAVRFFRNESCGKCVPCRVGSQKTTELLDGWMNGNFKDGDLQLMDELCHMMKEASICGLGQIIPAPIQSVLKHFREDVEKHLLLKQCSAGVCFSGANA